MSEYYVACMADGSQADLNSFSFNSYPFMSIQYCYSLCYLRGHQYAGLQAGYLRYFSELRIIVKIIYIFIFLIKVLNAFVVTHWVDMVYRLTVQLNV